MAYMSQLSGKSVEELADELRGVIFQLPGVLDEDGSPSYVTADEYLSGNVRQKLAIARRAVEESEVFRDNVEALEKAQPKDLEAELDIIRQKMQEVGVRNMGAYLRKMAMDGYCIRLDLGDLKKVVSLMRYASNNLNQYARKANETGSVYLEDIQDLQKRFDLIWEELKGIHTRLASIE